LSRLVPVRRRREGGPTSYGTIGQDGVYHAPASLPGAAKGVLVKATLAKDPRVYATALVTVPAGEGKAAAGGISLANLTQDVAGDDLGLVP
jgi:hypothetical protein